MMKGGQPSKDSQKETRQTQASPSDSAGVASISRHTPYLPPELVDAIIDIVAQDGAMLKACSLTCRSWLYRSQYHLHRRVSLHLASLLAEPERYSTPAVSQYVETLSLSTIPSGPKFGLKDTLASQRRRKAAWNVLARLSHVRCLILRSMHIHHEAVPMVIPRIPGSFQNVTSLILRAARFGYFSDFVAFVAAFQRLSRLDLKELWWYSWVEEMPANFPAIRQSFTSRLEFLAFTSYKGAVDSTVYKDFVSLFQSAGHCILRQLRLCNWALPSSSAIMSTLLDASGHTLTHLELPMCAPSYFFSWKDPTLATIGLHHLSRLEVITFARYDIESSAMLDGGAVVPSTLAQIRSKYLKQVVLKFVRIPTTSFSVFVNLSSVDEVLSMPQFINLQAVDVMVEFHNHEDTAATVEAAVRWGLQRTVERGIVRLRNGNFGTMVYLTPCV